MTRIPSVLGTEDLPMAELCAARIDGDLGVLSGGFVPVDEPDRPELRAAALANGLDRSLILDRRSAAWVHDAVAAPPRDPQLCRSIAARGTAQPGAGVRELVLAADEIVEFQGVRCTSRARTALDLLRDPDEPSAEVEAIVARLLSADDRIFPALRRRLLVVRRPYRALALARLQHAEALVQPSATR